jgi:hypothetical protein
VRTIWLGTLIAGLLGCGRTDLFDLERAGGAPERTPPAQCTGALAVTARRTLEIDATTSGPAFAGGRAILAVEGQPSKAQLLRFPVEGGAGSALSQAALRILDAQDRTVLFTVQRSGAEGLISLRDGEEVELGVAAPQRRGVRAGHNIDGDLVGACTSEWSLGGYDYGTGQLYATLAQGGPCNEPVFTAGRNLVYLRQGQDPSDSEVVYHLLQPNGPLPVVIRSGRGLASPVLFGDRLFVIDGGRVEAIHLPTRATELIHPGPCASLDASARGVVLACQGGREQDAIRALHFYDGETLRPIATDGRRLFGPRLGDGFVAWLAYRDEIDLCQGGRDAGEVLVAPLDGSTPFSAAGVDLGCACCGRFWPEPYLDVEADTLVFNYDASSPSLSEIRIGAARVGPRCS